MTTDLYITGEQVKDYFDNPPPIVPTQKQIESAIKLIDKYHTFIGEPTNDN